MKKRYKIFLFLIIGIVLIFVYSRYIYTFEFSDGEVYKGPVKSPTGEYTANAYYKPYGGAAGGVNVWMEITYNEEDDKTKTIYYAPGKSHFSMKWKDEDTLDIINQAPEFPSEDRSVELQVGKEIYDESGAACNSIIMKDEYETCYERDEDAFILK
ncbi:DUF5412 family protein [Peribacillus sp. NPDC096379]|uniref:DUF5412 family protein n=1 Tax=Peribacillus sp. NPDC096379 TaxID=3364393 RepID=UPI00380AFD0A